MSDTKSGDDKTLGVNVKKTLTLKRPGLEQSTVRQNFSHGRTKSVVVETKRKFVKPGDRPEPSVFTQKPAPAPQPAPARPVPPTDLPPAEI
ncbi:MAG: translation initiation factor IF-2 associated domain-containing protein, partial [Rhizobiaceae bacterium]